MLIVETLALQKMAWWEFRQDFRGSAVEHVAASLSPVSHHHHVATAATLLVDKRPKRHCASESSVSSRDRAGLSAWLRGCVRENWANEVVAAASADLRPEVFGTSDAPYSAKAKNGEGHYNAGTLIGAHLQAHLRALVTKFRSGAQTVHGLQQGLAGLLDDLVFPLVGVDEKSVHHLRADLAGKL